MKKIKSFLVLLLAISLLLTGCNAERAGNGLWSASNQIYHDINGGEPTVDDIYYGRTQLHVPTGDDLLDAADAGLYEYYGDGHITSRGIILRTKERAEQGILTAAEAVKQVYGEFSEIYKGLKETKKKADSILDDVKDITSGTKDVVDKLNEKLDGIGKDQAGEDDDISDVPVSEREVYPADSLLEVQYIDVGQGDCVLVRQLSKEDKSVESSMMIDTGTEDNGIKLLAYLKKQGINHLDLLVLTHNHADHIGSADVIIEKVGGIGNIFMSDVPADTATYRDTMQAIKYMGYEDIVSTPGAGERFQLGDMILTFLCDPLNDGKLNDSSLAFVLQHGDNSFLFTGDAEEPEEKRILSQGIDISCDVYKAGHHGSNTASSQALLDRALPEYCVISCGKHNDYYHPHGATLNKLRKAGVKVFRTDEQGTVIAESDGEGITFNCAPSDSWKAGEGPG